LTGKVQSKKCKVKAASVKEAALEFKTEAEVLVADERTATQRCLIELIGLVQKFSTLFQLADHV
jgi:hypothetical protein